VAKKRKTLYDQVTEWLRNRKSIVVLMLLSAAIIGFAAFTEGAVKLGRNLGVLREAVPALEVLDIVASRQGSVEFKIKNSGNDSAFITGIEFLLGVGFKTAFMGYPVIAQEYSNNGEDKIL
jgi:hypothetical protein